MTVNDTSDVERLATAMKEAIRKAVEGKDIAVSFSGGLDSGIVAAISRDYAKTVTLYTAGTDRSYDVRESEEMSKKLGIDWMHIPMTESNLSDCVRDMLSISEISDAVTLSFEVPLYYVSKHCREKDIIGGQGADEIFAGYSKYVGLPENEFGELRKNDIRRLTNVTLAYEESIAGHFGKKLHYPYLDAGILSIADGMKPADLMPNEDIRKGMLRDVASYIGQPEIASKRKKASQYGSGTMDLLRKISKKNRKTVNGMIAEWRS